MKLLMPTVNDQGEKPKAASEERRVQMTITTPGSCLDGKKEHESHRIQFFFICFTFHKYQRTLMAILDIFIFNGLNFVKNFDAPNKSVKIIVPSRP